MNYMNTQLTIKSILISAILSLLDCNVNFAQNVAIGETLFQAHPSSLLELRTSERGFLITRLTTTQRNAIQSPAEALMIFNTTTQCLEIFVQGWHSIWCDTDTGFVCGTSTITFTYNSAQVIYGTVVGANDKCWLDRNLGASQVATSSTDQLSYGDLFQWGRASDGHHIRTSGITSGNCDAVNSDNPTHTNFIKCDSGNRDWRFPQNHTLWQGVNGTNNPCPAGWHIPSIDEWNAEIIYWTNANDAFNSPLKFSLAGRRLDTSGLLNAVDAQGLYWTSTIDGISSQYIFFNSSNASNSSYNRALGGSVRCIKD